MNPPRALLLVSLPVFVPLGLPLPAQEGDLADRMEKALRDPMLETRKRFPDAMPRAPFVLQGLAGK